MQEITLIKIQDIPAKTRTGQIDKFGNVITGGVVDEISSSSNGDSAIPNGNGDYGSYEKE